MGPQQAGAAAAEHPSCVWRLVHSEVFVSLQRVACWVGVVGSQLTVCSGFLTQGSWLQPGATSRVHDAKAAAAVQRHNWGCVCAWACKHCASPGLRASAVPCGYSCRSAAWLRSGSGRDCPGLLVSCVSQYCALGGWHKCWKQADLRGRPTWLHACMLCPGRIQLQACPCSCVDILAFGRAHGALCAQQSCAHSCGCAGLLGGVWTRVAGPVCRPTRHMCYVCSWCRSHRTSGAALAAFAARSPGLMQMGPTAACHHNVCTPAVQRSPAAHPCCCMHVPECVAPHRSTVHV